METTNLIEAGLLEAITLAAQLAAVDLAKVPTVSTDRHMPRKEQAAAARKLFRRLGIKSGISITTPNYSMASSVDVRIAKRDDYTFDECGDVRNDDPARVANNAASAKVGEILLIAFPNHNDRSDSQSDHFDFKWSIN